MPERCPQLIGNTDRQAFHDQAAFKCQANGIATALNTGLTLILIKILDGIPRQLIGVFEGLCSAGDGGGLRPLIAPIMRAISFIAEWHERPMMNLANKSLMQNFRGLWIGDGEIKK